MSMTDPLSDMFVRIRNGHAAQKNEVTIPFSRIKYSVCQVLKDEGYIDDVSVETNDNKKTITVKLKYFQNLPVINSISRVSKPGRRIYKKKDEIPNVLGGLGISIVTTSKGVMTDKQARKSGHGGEILCIVS